MWIHMGSYAKLEYFCPFGGIYSLSKLAHFLSLTLLSSDLITRTNRIDLD